MSNTDEHVAPAGGHYSGRNKVPNIQEFMAQLDSEKRERDANIDADLKRNKTFKEVKGHNNEAQPRRKDTRSVRDPVTGKDVEIRDVKLDAEGAVENPQVWESISLDQYRNLHTANMIQMSVPNENLGKSTTVPVTSGMSGEEYRHAQDITAPPDPVEPGSTSDVPIRSEKTSVLFYKTPSVSYEPMFKHLEHQGNFLCGGRHTPF